MLNRRALMASATALPLTSMIPAAWAATPKDTVVFAAPDRRPDHLRSGGGIRDFRADHCLQHL